MSKCYLIVSFLWLPFDEAIKLITNFTVCNHMIFQDEKDVQMEPSVGDLKHIRHSVHRNSVVKHKTSSHQHHQRRLTSSG